MRNNRGMAMMMVIVFMFLSHLLYYSIIAFNHSQVKQYQGFVDFYQAGIQKVMAEPWFKTVDYVQQTSQVVEQAIRENSKKLLRNQRINHIYNPHPQIIFYEVENSLTNENKLICLIHQIYLEEGKVHKEWLDTRWEIEGVINAKNLSESYQESALMRVFNDYLSELNLESHQFKRDKKIGYYKQLIFPWSQVTSVSTNIGEVNKLVKVDGMELLSQIVGFDTREFYPNQSLKIQIDSSLYLFQ